MKRLLIAFALLLLVPATFAQGPILNNGQSITLPYPCIPAHKDLAVNNQVVLTVPAPPRGDLYVYICGWDWQAVQDGTATAQTNVLWTTTNFGGVAAEYSFAATPNALVSGAFYYPQPIAAPGFGPVIFTSPAAAAHVAYSVNVFYAYGIKAPNS